MKIFIMMPALNEAAAIGRVIAAIDRRIVQKIIVADNGSTDNTAAVAQAAGAIVVHTAQRGYGYACLAAMAFAEQLPEAEQPDIVVFLDADFSDFPNEIPLLIAPILHKNMDMVIGSRVLGAAEKGALMPVQRFGKGFLRTSYTLYIRCGLRIWVHFGRYVGKRYLLCVCKTKRLVGR